MYQDNANECYECIHVKDSIKNHRIVLIHTKRKYSQMKIKLNYFV